MKFHTANKPKKSRLRLALVGIAIVVAALGVFTALDALNVVDLPGFRDTPPTTGGNDNTINYGPPTEEEKKETEDFKKDLGDSPSTPSPAPPAGQKKAVSPVVSSWGYNKLSGNVEISGYVPDVIENGGTCTLTLEKAGQKVTESKSAIANAQNTSCGLITVARNRVSDGSWAATLTYSSNTAAGTSQAVTVEVN